MLIKMTVKEMAALALALQERPEKSWGDLARAVSEKLNEKAQSYEKIVPPETESRNGFSVGDLVICRALDEWAGAGKVFEVSGFYNENAAVNDGIHTFVIPTHELLHIAPGANLIADWSQYAKV